LDNISQVKKRKTTELKPEVIQGYYNNEKISELPTLQLFSEDIEFENEKEIKCATVDKIIEFITNANNSENNSMFTFMLSYRSFLTPLELIEKLRIRYMTPFPSDLTYIQDQMNWIKVELIPTRLKITQLLKLWLEQHFHDVNVELENKFTEFIQLMESTNGTKYGKSIESTMTRMKSNSSNKKLKIEKSNLFSPKNWSSLEDWNIKEVAKQITFREYLMFKDIGPGECVNKAWSSNQRMTKAPNIHKMISWFNLFSSHIAVMILQSPNLKDRVKTLSFVINLANEFKSINNINGIYEIISSLNLASVHRLKKTWELLPQKDKLLYSDLSLYLSNDSNFKFIRDQISTCIPPLVPYLGIFLTDLTFIDEGNPDFVNEKINFTKVKRVSKIIKNLNTYQQTPYDIKLHEGLQNYFDQLDVRLEDEEMYELSLLREPREK
jgi:son of sevenless